jgi:small subunit ribosomal protein S2
MRPYIFGTRNKIHIIDVKETLKGLLISKKLLSDVVSSGKDVIFVGTKRQAKDAVRQVAEGCGMHHVSERWLGGMLTNFRTVRSRLQRLEQLEKIEAEGKIAEESKKQASRMKREMRKIETNLGGVRKMNRLPGAVIAVDVGKEHLALREARKLGIMTIGIIDTNSDPDCIDIAIPANDDSIKAIEIILKQLAQAITTGKTIVRPTDVAPDQARGKSKRPAMASASEGAPAPVKAAPVKAEPAAPAPVVEAAPVAPVAPAAAPAKEAAPAEEAKPAEEQKPAE